jgi:hypothetical protein
VKKHFGDFAEKDDGHYLKAMANHYACLGRKADLRNGGMTRAWRKSVPWLMPRQPRSVEMAFLPQADAVQRQNEPN